jgi:hypothetical protein
MSANEPAFPRDHRHDGHNGMTLRQYYKAAAPTAPQDWFVPTMPPKPKAEWRLSALPEWRFDGYEAAVRRFNDSRCGGTIDDINEPALREWEKELQKQRFIQWPGAWADALLSEDAAFANRKNDKE